MRFDALLGPRGRARSVERLRKPEPVAERPKQVQHHRPKPYAQRQQLMDPWKRARLWEANTRPKLRSDGATPFLVALRALRQGLWTEAGPINEALGVNHWTGYAMTLVKRGLVEVSRESGQEIVRAEWTRRAQKRRDRWRITPLGLAWVELLD